jgi:hypothetical protein
MDTKLYIQILGGIFIVVGILIRLGFWKGWYWRSRGGGYAYIPMGIVLLLYTYISEIEAIGGFIYYGYIALFLIFIGLTVYFSLRPPEWMKPKWVKWVEKYPKSVVKAMKEAALEGNLDWKDNLDDEESIDKMAKKYR